MALPPGVPGKKIDELVINKLLKNQYIYYYDTIKTDLSDELFMTVNDPQGNLSGYMLYLPQAEYDQKKNAGTLIDGLYYATPDPAGSNPV